MSRPTFVCVPGAAHSPIIYDPVKSVLAYHGYEVVPLGLPSVGGTPATYDFTEDVRTIRNYIAQLADTGRDVILVMHGYSGIPGGEALRGLAKSDRERRGLRGGVIRLVFIMAVCYYSPFFSRQHGVADLALVLKRKLLRAEPVRRLKALDGKTDIMFL